MDEDMSFPNPVERHDLPVKKARWPKVVAAMLVVGLLGVAFLPQILHTRIGVRLVRARLEGRYAGEVALEDFRTSWFGGTSARQFWIKGTDGRSVGFAAFQSDKLSLFKLLRNKYELGHCTIDGLAVQYLLDAGDANHTDSFERLTGTPPRTVATPPAALSKLSGQVTLTNAQLSLDRSQMDAKSLQLETVTAKFTNLHGTFDIPSLDVPWTFKLEGNDGLNASGKLCLGKAGLLTPANVSADVTATADALPTDLCAVLLPQMNLADARSAFGDSFDHASVSLKGSGGSLKLTAQAAGPRGNFSLSPTFDLKVTPAWALVEAADQSFITCALPRGYAGTQLGIANPLLLDATDGKLTLRLTSFEGPFSRAWTSGTGKATLEVSDVKYTTKPGRVLRQVAALAGTGDASNTVRPAPQILLLGDNAVSSSATPIDLGGGATASLSGHATVNGELHYLLALKSPALNTAGVAPLRVPLVGKFADPKVDAEGTVRLAADAAPKVRQWVNQQVTDLRERDAQARQREKELQVQEFVKPLIEAQTTQP